MSKNRLQDTEAISFGFSLWCHLLCVCAGWKIHFDRLFVFTTHHHHHHRIYTLTPNTVHSIMIRKIYTHPHKPKRKCKQKRREKRMKKSQNTKTQSIDFHIERTIFKNGFSNVIYWLDAAAAGAVVAIPLIQCCWYDYCVRTQISDFCSLFVVYDYYVCVSQLFNSWSNFIAFGFSVGKWPCR